VKGPARGASGPDIALRLAQLARGASYECTPQWCRRGAPLQSLVLEDPVCPPGRITRDSPRRAAAGAVNRGRRETQSGPLLSFAMRSEACGARTLRTESSTKVGGISEMRPHHCARAGIQAVRVVPSLAPISSPASSEACHPDCRAACPIRRLALAVDLEASPMGGLVRCKQRRIRVPEGQCSGPIPIRR